MALHFDLKVNGRTIGTCVVRCLANDRGAPEPDAVYDYAVQVDTVGPPRARYTTTVQHRYSDGPWRLTQLALAQAASHSAGATR